MKKTFVYLVLFFNCLISAHAEIKEIMDFDVIKEYGQKGTLLIFDIDNTLIVPAQELGTDTWFNYRMDFYKNEGLSPENALEKALAEWEGIQNLTKVCLVEKEIAEIIRQLQTQEFYIIGLTTRGLGLATRTVHQLKSVDIDLSITAPSREDIFLMASHGILFRKGILFTSGTHKGEALKKLLEALHYNPEKIVFVNDKLSHIKPVEEECQRREIPFVGLRYGRLDTKVKSFRKDIADVQFRHFSHILSDMEAEKLIAQK